MHIKNFIGNSVDKIKNYRSRTKIKIDKHLEPVLFWLSTNAGILYGGDKTLDFVSQNIDSNEGLAMLGTYAGIGLSLGLANKKVISPLTKKIKKIHNSRFNSWKEDTGWSWVKTASEMGSLAILYAALNFGSTINNYTQDLDRVVNAFSRNNKTIERIINEPFNIFKSDDLTCDIPRTLTKTIKETNKWSDKGRFLRQYRWDCTVSDIEKKYSIPDGLLSGLGMQEGAGDPLSLNSINDGGAGNWMFQPGTAKQYGLKIHGTSKKTGRDRNHGWKLLKLVENKNWSYSALSNIDERFSIPKSADAAGRYLRDLHNRYGSWDNAISAYNLGRPGKNPEKTTHVKCTRKYQKQYLENKLEMGKLVNTSVLESLNDFGVNFDYIRKNSKGKDVFKWHVGAGENPQSIAKQFNEWDMKKGDKYKELDSTSIKKADGSSVGNLIFSNRPVYVTANVKS
jgi:hypothetical protein